MNLNKVFLIGRLAADPETRMTPSGQQVSSVRLVTNRIYNDKSGQKQEVAEFHSIVCWAGLADICQKYLRKGQIAFFEGRLQTRSWQGNDGIKRYKTEIIAETMQLGPKSASSQGYSGVSDSPASRPTMNSSTTKAPSFTKASGGKSDVEEEIPIINEDAPISEPIGRGAPESDVEEAEIDLKDIPF